MKKGKWGGKRVGILIRRLKPTAKDKAQIRATGVKTDGKG
jgi:hypothetical protein